MNGDSKLNFNHSYEKPFLSPREIQEVEQLLQLIGSWSDTIEPLNNPLRAVDAIPKPGNIPELVQGYPAELQALSNGCLMQSVQAIPNLRNETFMDPLGICVNLIGHDNSELYEPVPEEVVLSGESSNCLSVATESAEDLVMHPNIAGNERMYTRTMIGARSASPPSEGDPAIREEAGDPNSRHRSLTAQRAEEQGLPVDYSTKRKRCSHERILRGPNNMSGECTYDFHQSRITGYNVNADRDTKATRSLELSTEFIVHHFGIKLANDESRSWQCPFPKGDALPNGRCLVTFGVHDIRSHIREHVDKHQTDCPQEPLQCPLRPQDRCKWAAVTGANREFPRHVAEVHLHVNAATCTCGTSLARGTRDQIVRHLRRGHQENLEEKRKTDPNTPAFVDVDDPQLVKEEEQWRKCMKVDGEDNGGEGPSDGRTKRRRFFLDF